MIDGRYDIICTGSLLGIKGYNKKRGKGIPVGFEHTVYMYPMDFEEFLWAKGIGENVTDYLKECKKELKPISSAVHSTMLRYFYEYICVGGLPYVVDRFIKSNNMSIVRKEQLDLIEGYKDDFGKHLDENEYEVVDVKLLAKTDKVFNSIPGQLARENKKFTYSNLEKKGRAETYQSAISWLVDFGLVNICHNLENIAAPVSSYAISNKFKLYF